MSEFNLFSNIFKKIGFFITKFKNNEIDKNILNKKIFVILNLILEIQKFSYKKINKILPNHKKIINNIYLIEYEMIKIRKIDPKIKNPNIIKFEIEKIKKMEDEIITNEIKKVKNELTKDLTIPTLNFYIPFNYISFTYENDYYNNITNKEFYNNNNEEFYFEQEPILNNKNNNNFETDLLTTLNKLNDQEFIQNNNNNIIINDNNFDNLDFKEFKSNLNSSKYSINNIYNINYKEDEFSYYSMNISNVKTCESSYVENQNILYKIDFEIEDENFSISKKFQTISLKTFTEKFLDFKNTENLLKLMNIDYLNIIFNFYNIIKNQANKTVDFLQEKLFLNYIKIFIFKIGISNKNDYDDFLLFFNKKITFETFVEYFNKILNSDNKIIKIKYLLYLIIYSNDNKLFFDNINQPENYKINENQINFLFSFFSCNVFKNDVYISEVKKNLFNLYNNRFNNVNNVINNSNENNYVNKENNCINNNFEFNKLFIILEIINENLLNNLN